MSASSAWSWGDSANENRPMIDDADPQPDERRAGEDEHAEPDGTAQVRRDDQRLAAEAIGQPAREQRHRDAEHDERAVHQAGRRIVEADHAGHVDQREEVDDPEPATAATQDRGQEDPAQVAIGEDPAQRVEAAAAGPGGCPVRAVFADEGQDAERDDASRPRRTRRTRHASRLRPTAAPR